MKGVGSSGWVGRCVAGARAWAWVRLGLCGMLCGAGIGALAGELVLDPLVVSSGGGTATSGSWALEVVVGQPLADSGGTEALGDAGKRVQVGYLVQATPWNRPPVPGGDSVARPRGNPVTKVRVATLLANDTDADADPLTWVSVGRAQPSGATVTVVDGLAVYVASAGDAGHGSFEYEVTDGQGNVAWGLVTVRETAPGGVGVQPNAVRLEVEGVDRVFTGIGVPGRRYRVQYTLEVAAPYVWRDFDPVADRVAATTGALGLFQYVDRNPVEAQRLYRAVAAP